MLASFGVSAPALAESCAGDIDQVQSQVDAALAQHAETAPFAPETSFATLGHQPTPATVARAEAGLEHWAGGDEAVTALTRARDADAAGSASQCLADVQAARRALRTP
jgi:hypothetical protein